MGMWPKKFSRNNSATTGTPYVAPAAASQQPDELSTGEQLTGGLSVVVNSSAAAGEPAAQVPSAPNGNDTLPAHAVETPPAAPAAKTAIDVTDASTADTAQPSVAAPEAEAPANPLPVTPPPEPMPPMAMPHPGSSPDNPGSPASPPSISEPAAPSPAEAPHQDSL